MIIYIVKKHRQIYTGWFGSGYAKAFEIHSTHHTRKEANIEVKKKNKKAKDYSYIVGKVELKEQA